MHKCRVVHQWFKYALSFLSLCLSLSSPLSPRLALLIRLLLVFILVTFAKLKRLRTAELHVVAALAVCELASAVFYLPWAPPPLSVGGYGTVVRQIGIERDRDSQVTLAANWLCRCDVQYETLRTSSNRAELFRNRILRLGGKCGRRPLHVSYLFDIYIWFVYVCGVNACLIPLC